MQLFELFKAILLVFCALFGISFPETCYSCDVITYGNGNATGDASCEQPGELTPTVTCANYCSSSKQVAALGTHTQRGCSDACGLQRFNWTALNETQLSFLARTFCCNGDYCNTAVGSYQLDDTAASETNRCFSCSYTRVRVGNTVLEYGDQSCLMGLGIPYLKCPQNLCVVSTAFRSSTTWDIQAIDRYCADTRQLPVIVIQNGVNTIFVAQQGVSCTNDLCNGPDLQFTIPPLSQSTSDMGGTLAGQSNGCQAVKSYSMAIATQIVVSLILTLFRVMV